MSTTVQEVINFVKDEKNDIKFIRLVFCDLFGQQKNISIMPDELPQAFAEGISFDSNAIHGFGDVTRSDLLLVPDPDTLAVLPWRPQQGRVVRFYCRIRRPSGGDFTYDTRGILERITGKYREKGYTFRVGVECEFYLFKTDMDGEVTDIPYDNGSYLDISPLDKAENIRREICFCLEDMGIKPESSHHEQGPGQNEIDFKFSDALASADNIQTFKTVAKSISALNGLYASFLPKPLDGKSGNGLHINISLLCGGVNIFKDFKSGHASTAESFTAGVLEKAAEMTVFLNPIVNSYQRLGAFEAPKYVSWSHENRSQLIRIPAAKGEKVRMELRSPDPAANPYLAMALIIGAGMEGIDKGLTLPEEVKVDLYTADKGVTSALTRLPQTLHEAVELAKGSEFMRACLGDEVFERYIEIKEKEAEAMFKLSLSGQEKPDPNREKYFKIV
ncbi:MAG: glutamine synthetase family protein [Peptococcaceae bacterium]|jgi:glutamine synthetase|nr:glutamine synthetase family protein [Peptococcaceae bacterium]